METPVTKNALSVAVFASDKGPGNAGRSSIMSEAGTFLAKKGARIICPVSQSGLCVPLVKSARAAGGDVLVVADESFAMPSAISGIEVERFATPAERRQRVGEVSNALLGLPGSLDSVTNLYETWVQTGSVKPVALLNRNRAYEVLRGFAADIYGYSASDWERRLQISENIDELWSKLTKVLATG